MVPVVQIGGAPGRCGSCLQMGYFPVNHDYMRKGIFYACNNCRMCKISGQITILKPDFFGHFRGIPLLNHHLG